MDTGCKMNESQISEFKQEIFAKLTEIGMSHGDVAAVRHLWKFVNLAVKLGTDRQKDQSQSEKLVRVLSKELGAPRSQLFVTWLAEKIHQNAMNAKELKIPSLKPGDLNNSVSSTTVTASIAMEDGSGIANSKDVVDLGTVVAQTGATLAIVDGSALKIEGGLSDSMHAAPDIQSSGELAPPTSSIEDEGEAWVECKAGEGKMYYWDRHTNACAWALPAGVTPKWVSHKAADGRTYYADRDGITCWVMPPLKKKVCTTCGNTCGNTCMSERTSKPAASASSLFYLPDVGVVEPVNLPPAAEEVSTGDLGPFESAFALNELEALLPSRSTVDNAANLAEEESETPVLPAESGALSKSSAPPDNKLMETEDSSSDAASPSKEMSSDVASLRDELAMLNKQLAEMDEAVMSPSSPTEQVEVAPPCSRLFRFSHERTKINSDLLDDPKSAADLPQNEKVDKVAAEDSPLRRKRSAARQDAKQRVDKIEEKPLRRTKRGDDAKKVDGWELWSRSGSASNSETPGSRGKLSFKEIQREKRRRRDAGSEHGPCSADSDNESQASVETVLSLDEEQAVPEEHARSSRSRSPHGQDKCKKQLESSPLLDKFLTSVRHGKPPGAWSPAGKSASDFWSKSKETSGQSVRQRRASAGGA